MKHARNVLAVAVLFVVLGNGNFVLASGVRVVATIAPVHSLVSMVMGGVGEPALLLEGGETPHRYSLRPSQSRLLAAADHGMHPQLGPGVITCTRFQANTTVNRLS